MQSLRLSVYVLILAAFLIHGTGAAGSAPSDFKPDPRSIQRYGPAYRYPQAGWIVLHVEGEPYERGYQHGRLLAPEIAAYVRCFAALRSPKAPPEGWKTVRALANALFVRRYDQEYLEEMKGIADGATAVGARFDDRPIDLVDIVAINAWPEIDTLDSALEATPTGLESRHFPHNQPRATTPPKPMHCSAFAATGPATADGKIVFGHITMFSLYASGFYNVWLDIKPAKGHRVLMQSYPGGIQSGMDYYMNDAGLLVSETTITQTHFDIKGLALASRIRRALQYADSIDAAVEILREANNGLYTNEWLLADIKTNEIAMFELGTAKSKLYRSSKGEWFGGTEGFYWGCNNTKDIAVRLETVAGLDGKPGNVVFRPADRDRAWLQLFAKHKGKIDAAFGKEAFTTPPLAAYPSLDAKFTTTDLARDLKSWALFGPPLGRTWKPTDKERERYPEIAPLVSNPWTTLHPLAPDSGSGNMVAVDLPERADALEEVKNQEAEQDKPVPTRPAWHGTLLPRSDADTWLAAAFADYEHIVALETGMRERSEQAKKSNAERDRIAVALYAHRAGYLAATRAESDVPLSRTHADLTQDHWYRIAAGKGVWVLHELRRALGDTAFEEMMDAFGRQNAGKQVSAAQFRKHVTGWIAEHPKKSFHVAKFFDSWLDRPGLPVLRLGKVLARPDAEGYQVEAELYRDGDWPHARVDVTIETSKGEVTRSVVPDAAHTKFVFKTDKEPRRLVVDKYGQSAKSNGGAFSVLSFYEEPQDCLIAYGTADDGEANRDAAEALQKAIIQRWANYTVGVKADKDTTDEELRTHHLLLVGRPGCNAIATRFQSSLPIRFGSQSFSIGRDWYAHPDSAVIVAAENPLNRRYSLVNVAGLSGAATLRAAPELVEHDQPAGEVILFAHGHKPRTLVLPAPDLVRDLPESSKSEARK